MFDSVHQFLYDNNVWLVPLALIVAAFFTHRIVRIVRAVPATEPLTRPAGRRTPRPIPAGGDAAKPIQQQFIPDKPTPPASVVAGEESRKHKGMAPTLRIRSDDQRPSTIGGATTEVMTPRGEEQSVGDEVGKLFAGLDDALKPAAEGVPADAAPKTSDSQRRASRLESLGFHHSIDPLKTPPPGSIVAPPESRAPTPAAAGQEAPALDDILARLDRVLADDQPAKPAAPAGDASRAATPTPAGDAKPVVKAPMWARADAQDEELDAKPSDPGQQLGLFDEDKGKKA